MKPCTKLLLMAALTLMIPAFGGRYDVHARILHRDGDPVEYRSYLESLFKEAGMNADWRGASSMQPEGGHSPARRTLLTNGGAAAPTCDGPTYSLCYSAVGEPYCCPMNADGSGKYYMCYSSEKHTCQNVADMSDIITVEPGSGPANSHVHKVQMPEVDSPEACYTVYPGTAGICGLVCGKAYCCPPEAPYCVGAQECLPDDGNPKLHECAGSSGAYN